MRLRENFINAPTMLKKNYINNTINRPTDWYKLDFVCVGPKEIELTMSKDVDPKDSAEITRLVFNEDMNYEERVVGNKIIIETLKVY